MNLDHLLSYIPPIFLLVLLAITYQNTVTSPNENQKSKLLETLQSNILRYLIPSILVIKIYNKIQNNQRICISTLTLLALSIMSSYIQFSKGFRLATIMIYTGYSYNCVFCPVASHMTYWFDMILPVLLILITKMKYDRGEKIVC